MDWQMLTEKLPSDWLQVMTILGHSLTAYPHQSVETWWRLAGKQLSWTEFLDFLTQLEPVSEGGGLIFRPLFYLLAENLQKHTLQFIYQHCDDISSTVLDQFLQILLENHRTKDEWIQLYLNLLQNRTICRRKERGTQKERTEKDYNMFQTSLTTEFNFSGKSMAQLQTICERLGVAQNHGGVCDDRGPFTWNSEAGEKELRKLSPPASGTSPMNVVGEGVFEECVDVPMEVSEMSLEKSVAVEGLAIMESVMTSDGAMLGGVVDDEVQRSVLKLKESWLSGQAVDPDVVILLKSLSPQQLQNVLEQMDMLNLPDTCVLLACQTMMDCALQQIGYQSIMLFANIFLLPQILKLEQSASRLFAAAVVGFVKTFPLHSIEGLLRPLLASPANSCGIPQSELVIKVIREALSNQHQQDLLCMLLDSEVKTWSDQMMLVVQSLIDAKVELSSDRLKCLLNFLEHNSLANSSNRKFGKLLLSSVQVYGHLLTTAELRQCSQMADSHKTFLSKSIKSTLAKLSTVS